MLCCSDRWPSSSSRTHVTGLTDVVPPAPEDQTASVDISIHMYNAPPYTHTDTHKYTGSKLKLNLKSEPTSKTLSEFGPWVVLGLTLSLDKVKLCAECQI